MRKLTQRIVFKDPDKLLHNYNHRINSKISRFDEFDSGDLILISEKTYFPLFVSNWFLPQGENNWLSGKYSKVGIILRNPTFIDKTLRGLFCFEIGDNKTKPIKFSEMYDGCEGAMFLMKFNSERDEKFNDKLREVCTLIGTNKIGTIVETSVSRIVAYLNEKLGSYDKEIPIKKYDSYAHYVYYTY